MVKLGWPSPPASIPTKGVGFQQIPSLPLPQLLGLSQRGSSGSRHECTGDWRAREGSITYGLILPKHVCRDYLVYGIIPINLFHHCESSPLTSTPLPYRNVSSISQRKRRFLPLIAWLQTQKLSCAGLGYCLEQSSAAAKLDFSLLAAS